MEVSHGPTLIDHNVLLSDCSLKLATQGVAVVHNLIAGFMTILHGALRFYNNIFIQKEICPALQIMADAMADSEWTDGNLVVGTFPYEDYPTFDEYTKQSNLYNYIPEMDNRIITTDILGMAFEPEQKFENPDGTPIVMDKDYFGKAWGANPGAGPFAECDVLKI